MAKPLYTVYQSKKVLYLILIFFIKYKLDKPNLNHKLNLKIPLNS